MEQVVDSSHVLGIVNTRHSSIADGWSVSGVPFLYSYYHPDGTFDQHMLLVPNGNGSAVVYGPVDCVTTCHWGAPTGVYNQIQGHDSAGLHNQGYERLYPDTSKEVFNTTGQLVYTVSRSGVDTVFYTYDGCCNAGRLMTISDPHRMNGATHAVTTIHYSANGISSIVEPGANGASGGGRTTTFTVGTDSLLRVVTDPDSVTTHFGYDSQRRLDSLTDRRASLWVFAYEPVASKLTQTTLPQVPIDNGAGSTTLQHPVLNQAAWHLVGVPTSATGTGTPAVPVRADTVRASVTDASGQTTRFTIDKWGQPMVSTDPIGRVTSIVRGGPGPFATQVTHPTGMVDTYIYDQFLTGHLNQSIIAGGNATVYSYGAANQVQSQSGTNQPSITYTLGLHGRVDSVAVAGVVRTRITYDALQRPIVVADAKFDSTTLHYDARTLNRDSVTSAQSRRFAKRVFDAFGRDSVRRASGEPSRTMLYDVMNHVLQTSDGVHPLPTTFAYDSLHPRAVTDPKGQTFATTYNALGWITQRTDPTGASVAFTYTLNGLEASITNRRNQRVTKRYDAVGRLIAKHDPAVAAADTFSVSANGRVGVVANGVSVDTAYTSVLGVVDSVTTWMGAHRFHRAYQYDSRHRLTSMVTTTTATGIDFMSRGVTWDATTDEPSQLTLNTATIGLHHDSTFFLTSVSFPGGATRSDTLSSAGLLLNSRFTPAPVDSALGRSYAYDSAYRIVEIDGRFSGASEPVRAFQFDGIGELVRDLRATSTSSRTCTITGTQITDYQCTTTTGLTTNQLYGFLYDAAGNQTQIVDSTHGNAITVAVYLPGNRDSTFGALTYQRDADGNRTGKSGAATAIQYGWSADGRLLSVTAGSYVLNYDYNALGQVVRRRRNGTADRYYLWDGNKLLAELDGAANARVNEYAYYPTADRPLAVITGAAGAAVPHYYAVDQVGAVIGTFTSGPEQGLTYDPWGRLESATTTTGDTTHLRWKGLLWEGDSTQLYYVRNRWYDPVSRRFITEDPLGTTSGTNQYTFAGGDPVNANDPTGLACREHSDLDTCFSGPAGIDGFGTPDGYAGFSGPSTLQDIVNSVCPGAGSCDVTITDPAAIQELFADNYSAYFIDFQFQDQLPGCPDGTNKFGGPGPVDDATSGSTIGMYNYTLTLWVWFPDLSSGDFFTKSTAIYSGRLDVNSRFSSRTYFVPSATVDCATGNGHGTAISP